MPIHARRPVDINRKILRALIFLKILSENMLFDLEEHDAFSIVTYNVFDEVLLKYYETVHT